MSDIYQNIKKRRQELGMSQLELAMKLGYSDRTTISKIESGTVDLSITKFQKLAEALRTTQSELMGWDDTFAELDAKADILSAIANDSDWLNSTKLYLSYTEDKKILIRNLISSLNNDK
jgi:transcriptional regulator with XRE-family HTH domain